MNLPDHDTRAVVATAALDAAGRLREAAFPLGELNARAGGAPGRPLAIASLATIARLAQRLGIAVVRRAVIADDDADLHCLVRAEPDGEGVMLSVSGWQERAPWAPVDDPDVNHRHFLRADADWEWETDAALRLVRVSIAAGQRHGFDAIDLLGKPITDLFALSADGGDVPLVSALARREPLVQQAAQVRPDGAAMILSATVRHDNRGEFAGFAGMARRDDAAAVAPASAAPAPASPLPSDFTAGLDRALRRPLTQIIANADSIHDAIEGPVLPDYVDYAADIANAGRHLLALVEDLVDLEAIERADFALPAERIDLADIARRAAGLLAVRASNRGVALARPDADVRLPATGDFRRALQVLVNLIGNAVRYAPAGSTVAVTATSDGGRAAVAVTDVGKGIAAADQDRVFDKFERVDPSEAGGNGLGLYIARRLARAMNGDISLRSAPGAGARFTLSLPADTPSNQDQH